MAAFYADSVQPLVPTIAVASGSFVFIYKNLRPFYKFVAPSREALQHEQDAWDGLKEGKISIDDAVAKLNSARDEGLEISEISRVLLGTDASGREAFVNTYKFTPLAVAVS